jgi:hypothetical protein
METSTNEIMTNFEKDLLKESTITSEKISTNSGILLIRITFFSFNKYFKYFLENISLMPSSLSNEFQLNEEFLLLQILNFIILKYFQ